MYANKYTIYREHIELLGAIGFHNSAAATNLHFGHGSSTVTVLLSLYLNTNMILMYCYIFRLVLVELEGSVGCACLACYRVRISIVGLRFCRE